MAREVEHVAGGVRDEPELQPGRAELLEDGQDVLVELEVLVVLPAARELDRDVIRLRLGAAHPERRLVR